jgi:hypothetical protein
MLFKDFGTKNYREWAAFSRTSFFLVGAGVDAGGGPILAWRGTGHYGSQGGPDY